jgi:hypothetical protein
VGKSAYIRLVDQSTTSQIDLEDVKQKLEHYISMTTKTGQQLAWDYAGAAFPYKIVEPPEGKGKWFYLKGNNPNLYKHIVVGVGADQATDQEGQEKKNNYIQIVLPDDATHGDKSKANEFCKYLAKTYQAKLELFNGRVMYCYPRKP